MRTFAGGFGLLPALMAAVTLACGQTGGKSTECARTAARPCDLRLGEGDVQTRNYFRGVTGKWEQVDRAYIPREKP